MRPNQISSADVISWLRSQSSRFATMADDIEATFGDSQSRPQVRSTDLLTVEAVVIQMNGRSMRVSSLAREMGRSKSEFGNLMTVENGFSRRNQRGWYAYLNSQDSTQ